MSISTLESPASRAALADLQKSQDTREAVEYALRDELRQALTGDLSAPCLFAPSWLRGHDKVATVGDVLYDALDAKDFIARAMVILANAAAGKGTQHDAQKLLDEATAKWADSNADMLL